MQLSRFSDYTLRVLFYAATHTDRLSTLSEIAGFYDISIEHLRKVVHALGKRGYLNTYRGKKGGVCLARPPEEINIGQVVADSEGTAPLVDCNSQPCRLAGQCTLQNALARAQQAFFDTLKEYTLADLLRNESMQARLIVSSEE
ncbi:MAG: Rrf2 family transcriptional regulator [Marinobacterium sp.]